MNIRTRLTVLLSALFVAVMLLVVPAAAAEGGAEGGAGTGDEREKLELPSTPRDQVGLVVIIVGGVVALFALDNARRQLKGERKQATGEWRWR